MSGRKEETIGQLRIQQVSGEETDSKPLPHRKKGERPHPAVRGICLLELLCRGRHWEWTVADLEGQPSVGHRGGEQGAT